VKRLFIHYLSLTAALSIQRILDIILIRVCLSLWRQPWTR